MPPAKNRCVVRVSERAFSVEVGAESERATEVRIEEGSDALRVEVLAIGEPCVVRVQNRVLELWRDASGRYTGRRPRAIVEVERAGTRRAARRGSGATEASGRIVSPMPGRIVKLLVAEGATVEAGAGLLVVEAMKMENELVAPRAGRVERVLVSAGDAVERDALLLELS